MRKSLALLAAGAMAAGTLFVGAGSASASQAYDPNVTRIANPANTCKSIPGSIEAAANLLDVTIDTSSFDYAGCVTTLAQGKAVVQPVEEFGDPYKQCDFLLTLGVSYPYVFHNTDSPEDQLLPDLQANNRKQCGSALYAFHEIFTALLPYLPPEPPQ
jgi:hypothetical protein